jgi:cytochrome P450
MKNPEKMAKLTRDVDSAFDDATLTHPVQYNQATKIPYLKAVIQEALRISPSFAVPMPRYAPAAGLQLSGYHIAAGYKVGLTFSGLDMGLKLTTQGWHECNNNTV